MRQKIILTVSALLLAALALLPLSAGAATETPGEPDFSQTATLSVRYAVDGRAAAGVPATLYRVADIENDSGGITFTLDGAFRGYSIEINGVRTTEEWDALAGTLTAYAAADAIPPQASGKSGSDGALTFADLPCGMYLVVSDRTETENGTLYFAPALVSLPSTDAQDEWNYSVAVYPKGKITAPSIGDVEYSVVKHWKNVGASPHPSKIAIAIAKDGVIQSRQTLSADNNWTYSWTAKDDGSVWSVIETDVPEQYTVTVENNQNTFIVTNTYTGEVQPTITGDSSPIIPYTIALAASGLCLILLGIVGKRKSDAE